MTLVRRRWGRYAAVATTFAFLALALAPLSPAPHTRSGRLAANVRPVSRTTTRESSSATSGDAQGIDIASFQSASAPISWPSVAGAGVSFAYIKATEGNYYTDPDFTSDNTGALQSGIVTGAYTFAVPDVASGTAEADYFLTDAPYVPNGSTLPPMVDLESDPYGSMCYGLPPSAMVSWIAQFVSEVQRLTGQLPLIYTSASWWNACTGNNATFGADPLFVADYSDPSPILPAGWSGWTLWQYGSQGSLPGITGPVDQDFFNGGLSALHQFADGALQYSPARPRAIGQSNGIVDVFYRGAQNSLLHTWFIPGAGWFGAQNFGGAVTGDPSPTSTGRGNQDVFWKGADGALWHVWYQNGAWYGPQSLGMGPLGGPPVSVSSSNGQVDVFWRGTDNGLWHAWFLPGAGWFGPQELWGAGALASDPTAVSASVETIDVFWEGTDGNLNRNWFNGAGWQGPTNFGDGPLGSAPTVASYGTNDDLVSWEGTDLNLWYTTVSSGAPGPLKNKGVGTMASGPVSVSGAPSEVDVVWRGIDDVGAHLSYQGGSWTGPAALPTGSVGSAPSVTVAAPQAEYVLWRGTDAGLWYTTGFGSSFSGVAEVAPGGSLGT